jgi:hypothetical protein
MSSVSASRPWQGYPPGKSHRKLERWRWTGEGPKFLKVGGRVVYRLSDVEEYEQAMIRSSTSDPGHAQQAGA